MSSVDKAADSQNRHLAQKRREMESQANAFEVDKAHAERLQAKQVAEQKEKADREMVQISKTAEKQVETVRKLNTDRIHTLNENTQKHFETLSLATADEIRRLDASAAKAISDHRSGSMERILNVATQTEDPFYRIRSLSPVVSENETAFELKVALPEHEARNVLVSGEGQSVKLTLARRFQEKVKDAESQRTTKTSSYQTVVEQIDLPSAFNARGIAKDYQDGVLTVRVPKALRVPTGLA